MNGHTHAATGLAATFAATYLCAANHDWIAANTPDWLSPLLTPPDPLLVLGGGTSANSLQLGQLNLSLVESGAVSAGQSLALLAAVAAMGILSGQVPDLDTPNSTISHYGLSLSHKVRMRGVAGFLLKAVLTIINIVPFTVSTIANLLFDEHRNGFIHGLVGLFGFSFGFTLLSGAVWHTPFWGFLFFIGYLTHLGVDSFSRSGVKWLWPLTDHSFHFLPKEMTFRTANPLHNALAQSLAVIITGWIGYQCAAHLPVAITPYGTVDTTNYGDGTRIMPTTTHSQPMDMVTYSDPPPWLLMLFGVVVLAVIGGILWSSLAEWGEFQQRQARGEV